MPSSTFKSLVWIMNGVDNAWAYFLRNLLRESTEPPCLFPALSIRAAFCKFFFPFCTIPRFLFSQNYTIPRIFANNFYTIPKKIYRMY